jgi:chloride channel protein, CIC family
MLKKKIEDSSTTEGLPVAPSFGPALEAENITRLKPLISTRILFLCALAAGMAIIIGFIAKFLIWFIAVVTNISFFGRLSGAEAAPADSHLGYWIVFIPAIGGIIVGLMARYGSKAIRGHGIPEAMEQVLTNESRIKPAITFLKPLSSAVSIGTGGPFGAEGPIIATGGAFGSLIGQLLHTSADERKILLTAGATAGMAAIFGSPVAAVMLAVELLLFEFSPRSIIPVAIACFTGTAMHWILSGSGPFFAMPVVPSPGGEALAIYIVLGALMGVAAAFTTRMVYIIEDAFEKLPVHWMWWPAIGGLAVGVIGYFAPHTMGVGYDNIKAVLSGNLAMYGLLVLCVMKFISWAIALGSGTSGGTLAPLFTIGGALGAILGIAAQTWFPQFGIDSRIAALVGMAAIFAGASRALLTSVIFAFETTQQPNTLLPLLGGCTVAYLVSFFMMKHSIMTEKIERRGVKTPYSFVPDILDQTTVAEILRSDLHVLSAENTIKSVKDWLNSGRADSKAEAFPVVNDNGALAGIVRARTVLHSDPAIAENTIKTIIKNKPVTIYPDNILRIAVDIMVNEDIDLLPVVERENPEKILGIITHKDIMSAYRQSLDENHFKTRSLSIKRGGIKIVILGRKLLKKND